MLEIITYPDPRLRQKAAAVAEFGGALLKTGLNLAAVLKKHRALGIAAPQVGVPLRLIALAVRGRPPLLLANPEVEFSEGAETEEEGCLSLPGVRLMVGRPARVRAAGRDLHGAPLSVDAEGERARAMMHEIDHLDGITIDGRAGEPLPWTVPA